jgi:tRNA dimethylallyltransferase
MLPADRVVFEQVEAELAAPNGQEELVRELTSAARNRAEIPPDTLRNPRRLARAIEVLRLTGRPPWEHANQSADEPVVPVRQFILLPTMAVLKPRIVQRTSQMLDAGWIEEGRRALSAGLLATPTAKQALGYREIAAYLEGDLPDREALLDALIRRTVRYARRQRTWFLHQHPEAEILAIDEPTTATALATEILGRLR